MKLCGKCGKTKPLTEFTFKKGKHKPQSYCKDCNREYQREHYHRNKEKYFDDRKQRRKDSKEKAIKLLLEYVKDGCVDCGEKDFEVLDFDHIEQSNKEYTISYMINNGFGVEKIKNELEKCRVLCSNCHRRRTAKQLGWYSEYLHLLETTSL